MKPSIQMKKQIKMNEVKVISFQHDWFSLFEKEKTGIEKINIPCVKSIDHVGSTSIKNMPAKPIVDILIGIDKFSNYKTLVCPLENFGYTFHSIPRNGQAFFFKEDKSGHVLCHLKIVRYNGDNWNKYQKFKEILNNNKRVFNEYKKLKLLLAKNNSSDRNRYTSLKQDFIKEILK